LLVNETSPIGFAEAAGRLGVTINVLRRAIRAGRVPAPAHQAATATLSAEWFASVQAAVAAAPEAISRSVAQKIPPFARYEGTSAWRKYPNRVREYARFRATLA
jgi:hypothetical protein